MNDLDELLRDWSARTEPTDDTLQALQRRIVSLSGSAEASTSRSRPAIRQKAGWQIAVTAAALVLSAAVLMSRPREQNVASNLPQVPDAFRAARQPLFDELDRMFDGHWQWFGEVNGRVHLQTAVPVTSESDVTDGGVAVRLVVIQRRPGEVNWQVVWEASVMARSDEWVRLPEELIGNNAVSVWTHSLPDGSMFVESNIALTAPVTVRSSEQQVFGGSARPTRLWSVQRTDGEFQLFQSVARLESHHG